MARNMPLPFNGPLSITAASAMVPGTVFESASRTNATYVTQEYNSLGRRGLRLIVDVDAVGAAGTFDLKLQTKNPITGEWHDLPEASITQITAAGQCLFQLYPGLEEDAGAGATSVSAILPENFRISMTIGVNAVTAKVWGELLG